MVLVTPSRNDMRLWKAVHGLCTGHGMLNKCNRTSHNLALLLALIVGVHHDLACQLFARTARLGSVMKFFSAYNA